MKKSLFSLALDFSRAALRRGTAGLFFAFWLIGCEADLSLREVSSSPPHSHLIYVVSNGYHSGIVVPASALFAEGDPPEALDFPSAVFLEFGWGDRAYYPAKKKTLIMTLTAGAAPTPAIMHIAAHHAPPKAGDSGREMLSLRLTEEGFQNLIKALSADFERLDGKSRAKAVSRGLTSDSYFYNARGEFHLFNTCNTWTAHKLQAGGVAISPYGIVTADGLMDSLRAVLEE